MGVGAPRPASRDLPTGVAPLRVLDLHHFGTHPCQGFGAGWAGLELRQVDDLYALQAVKGGEISAHPVGLLHSRNVAGQRSGTIVQDGPSRKSSLKGHATKVNLRPSRSPRLVTVSKAARLRACATGNSSSMRVISRRRWHCRSRAADRRPRQPTGIVSASGASFTTFSYHAVSLGWPGRHGSLA